MGFFLLSHIFCNFSHRLRHSNSLRALNKKACNRKQELRIGRDSVDDLASTDFSLRELSAQRALTIRPRTDKNRAHLLANASSGPFV